MADDLSRSNRFKQDGNTVCLEKSGFAEIQRFEVIVSSLAGHKNCPSDCAVIYVICVQKA